MCGSVRPIEVRASACSAPADAIAGLASRTGGWRTQSQGQRTRTERAQTQGQAVRTRGGRDRTQRRAERMRGERGERNV